MKLSFAFSCLSWLLVCLAFESAASHLEQTEHGIRRRSYALEEADEDSGKILRRSPIYPPLTPCELCIYKCETELEKCKKQSAPSHCVLYAACYESPKRQSDIAKCYANYFACGEKCPCAYI